MPHQVAIVFFGIQNTFATIDNVLTHTADYD